MARYKANWEVRGLTPEPIRPDDVVELEPEAAEPYVGRALTLVEDEDAAEPQGTELGTDETLTAFGGIAGGAPQTIGMLDCDGDAPDGDEVLTDTAPDPLTDDADVDDEPPTQQAPAPQRTGRQTGRNRNNR